MAQSEFPLPDVGEGLTEAEIVAWKVKPGDTVTVNQVLVEIETAKSLVELPSPFAGTVTELLFDEGATGEVADPSGDSSGSVLVGYGTKGGHGATRRRRRPGAVATTAGEGSTAEGAK